MLTAAVNTSLCVNNKGKPALTAVVNTGLSRTPTRKLLLTAAVNADPCPNHIPLTPGLGFRV